MKSITAEWIGKAEGDFATAQRELNAIQHPNYDAVCFHAQQCAEKYLKAFLQETNIAFPKTHDLTDLLALTLSVEPSWSSLTSDLNVLSSFAVEYRYPGDSADLIEARRAFKSVRMSVRSSVGH
ncbi:MAG TPA: HEPN domain-containing protein [Pyrinomonadaceae bacterium]|jgi:HEPN domain-containing protein